MTKIISISFNRREAPISGFVKFVSKYDENGTDYLFQQKEQGIEFTAYGAMNFGVKNTGFFDETWEKLIWGAFKGGD